MRCQVLNKDFPRIITFLRKERGLSQKQVAGDMGISQALLSHYEKGIRECGLDFLVKTAEYYGVSTDYLLGRTVQRNFTADPFEAAEKEVVINTEKGSMINKINRSLLMNTTSVIYDLLAKIGNKHLTNAVSNYLMSAEYVIFRTIYNSEKNNSQTMFSLDKNRYRNLTDASMILDLEIINELIENDPQRYLLLWVNNKNKETQYLIEAAISKNIIRKNKNMYYYGTDVIGRSMDEAVLMLDDKKNQDIRLAIMQEIESK